MDFLRLRGNLLLITAAFIWGTTFVAQQVGMDALGPFSYAAARYVLGFLAVLLIWCGYRRPREAKKRAGTYRSGWKAGIGAGFIMFAASSLQQVAMLYTTAGKTAFITCLYIIFVPLFSVFLKKRIRAENWFGAVLALMGLYFLCVKQEMSLSYGDTLLFISAFFWTFHILFIDRFAAMVDGIEISAMQIGVCAVLSSAVALGFADFSWAGVQAEAFPIFYAGVMSAGVAFTLQIIGQKYAEPAHAAIIMSFEAVFGALASWLLLHEVMSTMEIFGCLLMLAGMTVTQLGAFMRREK